MSACLKLVTDDERPAPEPRRRLRVLHVEDDPVDARIVDRVARATFGYDISLRRAASFEEARAAAAQEAFDLHIIDFWLGDAPAIKLLASPGFEAPIMMLSYAADGQTAKICRDLGVAAFLAKANLNAPAFEAAIGRALARGAAH